MLKTAFGNNAMGRTQISEWFSQLKYAETLAEDKSIQVVPPQVAQIEMRKLAKSITKTNEVPFWRSQAG
jgi:hypothetical protein